MALRGVTSDYERIEAYKAKVRSFSGTGTAPDYVAPVMQHKMNEVYRKIAARFAEQASFQARVSSYIGTVPVPFITRAGYHAFAAELYHLILNFDAGSVGAEAIALQAKWVARGLDNGVLPVIRISIFGIPTP
jgi:hypothetical protein